MANSAPETITGTFDVNDAVISMNVGVGQGKQGVPGPPGPSVSTPIPSYTLLRGNSLSLICTVTKSDGVTVVNLEPLVIHFYGALQIGVTSNLFSYISTTSSPSIIVTGTNQNQVIVTINPVDYVLVPDNAAFYCNIDLTIAFQTITIQSFVVTMQG
jgi:hypothetical protein